MSSTAAAPTIVAGRPPGRPHYAPISPDRVMTACHPSAQHRSRTGNCPASYEDVHEPERAIQSRLGRRPVDPVRCQRYPTGSPRRSPCPPSNAKPVAFEPDIKDSMGSFTNIANSTFKRAGPGPFPAVVLMHTCGGVKNAQNTKQHAQELLKAGYVVLVVDSFGPRGMENRVTRILSGSAGVADAYAGTIHPRFALLRGQGSDCIRSDTAGGQSCPRCWLPRKAPSPRLQPALRRDGF